MRVLAARLDEALVALTRGNRRRLLALTRDEPAAIDEMADQFAMSRDAVSEDLTMLHLAEYERQHEALASRYDPELARAAALARDSRVLDVGCGSGVSTLAAARVATAGTVLGLDLSAAFVRRGRERASAGGLSNAIFEQGDAQVHPFVVRSVDVVISRFGAMYFSDPVAAFSNVAHALRPGGQLALSSWQVLEANEWMFAIRDALALGQPAPALPAGTPGAFGLAEPRAVQHILERAGFVDVRLEGARERVTFGPDAERAFEFVSTLPFARAVLARLGRSGRSTALARLRTTLATHETSEGVCFSSSAWVTTARRS